MKAQFVNVTIDMGVMSKITKQVLAHEVALLREVRGAGSVILQGLARDENGKGMTREVNGNTEYERLSALYKTNEAGQLNVEAIYGRQGSGGLRAAIKGGINAIPEADEMIGEDEPGDEDGAGDTLTAADADDSGYTNMDEIKAALIDMSVDYSSKAKRDDLIELLEAASAVVAAGGDPAGKDLKELQAEAEQAAA